jgi:hypothetical protein
LERVHGSLVSVTETGCIGAMVSIIAEVLGGSSGET